MKEESMKKRGVSVNDHDTEEPMTAMLKRMSEIDIRTVNPDDLVDIGDVRINQDLPVKERTLDYIRQVKNPYCYISHGVVVKIGFTGSRKLEECLGSCVSMEA